MTKEGKQQRQGEGINKGDGGGTLTATMKEGQDPDSDDEGGEDPDSDEGTLTATRGGDPGGDGM